MRGELRQRHVSTHSRPKAAGKLSSHSGQYSIGFNSQPPEGGWFLPSFRTVFPRLFQLTAARRRLVAEKRTTSSCMAVSTHSRPKAAGIRIERDNDKITVSTHSRPKAAGRRANQVARAVAVSTHSRPKAAGLLVGISQGGTAVSTHSRPKAAGRPIYPVTVTFIVSTHSRPKAAGKGNRLGHVWPGCFNSQPPEGGWVIPPPPPPVAAVSTHSRPKAAGTKFRICQFPKGFQLTAARRRLGSLWG